MNNDIPKWKSENPYKGFDDPAYIALKNELKEFTQKLNRTVSDHSGSLTAEKLAEIMQMYNAAFDRYEELDSYIYCCHSVDTSDQKSLNEMNEVEGMSVPLQSFRVKFRDLLASEGEKITGLIKNDPYLSKFSFFFEEELLLQKHQMSAGMEELAADLARCGAESWTRLHNNITSTASALWDEKTGEMKTATQLRALAFSPDAETRKRAWQLENVIWKDNEVPLAFALNGVKGFSTAVNSRRSFESTLERSTMQSRISKETLEALIASLTNSLPVFRRYMRLKAGLLGRKTLPFFDLFAPVGTSDKIWSFEEASDFIVEKFTAFSGDLGLLASRAFSEGWIDALPRKNKIGGAYCAGLPLSGSSRIMSNFDGSFSGLTTVAHELGHAYHNHVLKNEEGLHRDFPMTLAETASIFCETIVFEESLKTAPEGDKLGIIETELMEANQVVVDILSRFIFEKEVMERRKTGELSASDFCSIMIDAQNQTYGDAMDPDYMHPYMWAVKGHYYRQDLAFYNFPYAFGKLFGMGLYSLYLNEVDSFPEKYRDLLLMTGKASAEQVTLTAGFDITSKDFWMQGIGLIEKKVDEFEELCSRNMG